MTSPFLGEIQLLAFNFAPYGWALASGQTIPLNQNATLYSLIGTAYGGNGTSTFQLPNFANATGMSQGQGPTLSRRTIGEFDGENTVTLTNDTMPSHNHILGIFSAGATAAAPTANAGVGTPRTSRIGLPYSTNSPTTLSPLTLQPSGQTTPHENRMPFLAVTYAIALTGAFPSFD